MLVLGGSHARQGWGGRTVPGGGGGGNHFSGGMPPRDRGGNHAAKKCRGGYPNTSTTGPNPRLLWQPNQESPPASVAQQAPLLFRGSPVWDPLSGAYGT